MITIFRHRPGRHPRWQRVSLYEFHTTARNRKTWQTQTRAGPGTTDSPCRGVRTD